MKKYLLASALFCAPVATHAQIVVVNPTETIQMLKDSAQQIKGYLLQYQQSIHEAMTDIQTAQMVAGMIANPSLGAAEALTGMTGLNNDLPVTPHDLMSLSSGYSMLSSATGNGVSLNGALSALRSINGFASSSYSTNHVYGCTGSDGACGDLNYRANALAGSMGLTQAAYGDVRTHLAIVQALRDQMSGITTPAQRETIMEQLQAEQLWTQNMQASLTSAQMQAAYQDKSFEQRNLERQRQSADDLFNNTQPITPASMSQPYGAVTAAPPTFSLVGP